MRRVKLLRPQGQRWTWTVDTLKQHIWFVFQNCLADAQLIDSETKQRNKWRLLETPFHKCPFVAVFHFGACSLSDVVFCSSGPQQLCVFLSTTRNSVWRTLALFVSTLPGHRSFYLLTLKTHLHVPLFVGSSPRNNPHTEKVTVWQTAKSLIRLSAAPDALTWNRINPVFAASVSAESVNV